MRITANQAREKTEANQIKNKKGINNVVDDLYNNIADMASRGKGTIVIDVNNMVHRRMDDKTMYHEVADYLESLLKDDGYDVEQFSEYKECSLRITWEK